MAVLLYDVLCEVGHDYEKSNSYELAIEYQKELLSVARKQIISEIENYKDEFEKAASMFFDAAQSTYYKGIEDVLNKIKEN